MGGKGGDTGIQHFQWAKGLLHDLCLSENPPEEYWRVLAEQRRLALAETLEENEQLHDHVERLKAQVSELENQVKDTSYFAMMYKLASTSEPEIH